MQRIVVREAREADVELLASFNQRMALETEGKALDEERLRRGVRGVLEQPSRGTYFVAERAGRAVGGCLVTREWSDWRDGDFWWFQSVFVLPEERGQGVFRTLYDHVHAAARARGDVCGLRLYVERENHRAQAVYEALGMHASHYRFYELDFVLGEPPGAGDASGGGR